MRSRCTFRASLHSIDAMVNQVASKSGSVIKVVVKKPAGAYAIMADRKHVVKKPAGAYKHVIDKKPAVRSKASHAQAMRHQEIVSCLRVELAEWVQMLEDGNVNIRVVECPVCGRVSNRRRNMIRHAKSHMVGRLGCLMGALETGGRVQHPVYMQVIRALHDHDSVVGNVIGKYAHRAQSLLKEWFRFETASSDSRSLFTCMGSRDEGVTLVLTKDGPQFWLLGDTRLESGRVISKSTCQILSTLRGV